MGIASYARNVEYSHYSSVLQARGSKGQYLVDNLIHPDYLHLQIVHRWPWVLIPSASDKGGMDASRPAKRQHWSYVCSR